MQNVDSLPCHQLINLLNNASEMERCAILKKLDNADGVLEVEWQFSRLELEYLLPKLTQASILHLLNTYNSSSKLLKDISKIFKGIKVDGYVKLIGNFFYKLNRDKRKVIYDCLKDPRVYAYSLRRHDDELYLKCILEELGCVEAYKVFKSVHDKYLEYIWDNSNNERVLNEIIKEKLCKNWKCKKVALKRNIGLLLLDTIQEWINQTYIYQQLLEFCVIQHPKQTSNLHIANNALERSTVVDFDCYLYKCCLSIPTTSNKQMVSGPLAYLWIKHTIFEFLINDTLSELVEFLNCKFDLCVTKEMSNNLALLYDLCHLYLKIKLKGISCLSSIKPIHTNDKDIQELSEFIGSFYSDTGTLGHAYVALLDKDYLEVCSTLDHILSNPPVTKVDKLIVYESFYLILPFLFLIKCPKLLIGLASSIQRKFSSKKMTYRLYKVQYWLDYSNLLKKKPISSHPHVFIESDLMGSIDPILKLKVDNMYQILSYLHCDELEIEYRKLLLSKATLLKVFSNFSSSWLSIKVYSFKHLVNSFKDSNTIDWVFNSLLLYPHDLENATANLNILKNAINTIFTVFDHIEPWLLLLSYPDLQYVVVVMLELRLIASHFMTIPQMTNLLQFIHPCLSDVIDLKKVQFTTPFIPSKPILCIMVSKISNSLIICFNSHIMRLVWDILEKDELGHIVDYISYFKGLIEQGQSIIHKDLDVRTWWKQRFSIDKDMEHALYLLNYRIELLMTICNEYSFNEWLSSLNELPLGKTLIVFYCDYFSIEPKFTKSTTSAIKLVHLLLDDDLSCLPIESSTYLQSFSIYRVPYFQFTIHPSTTRSLKQGAYVLNPSEDLIKTEQRLEQKLRKMEWMRQLDLNESKWLDLLEHDIVMYCGHGAGEKYYNPSKLSTISSNSVVLLMGCSSLKMVNYGLGYKSICEHYLEIGCTSVVGTLWDVTDKDLDVQTISLLEGLQFKKDLSEALKESRQDCKLKYLNASALVVYGNPVAFN